MRWLWLALAACGSSSTAKPIDAPPDQQLQQVDAVAALTWDNVETISNDGQVITERVTYTVDGLSIYARICRPNDSSRHKIAIYNHGGYAGLDIDALVARCADTAKLGFIWIGSSYRGE